MHRERGKCPMMIIVGDEEADQYSVWGVKSGKPLIATEKLLIPAYLSPTSRARAEMKMHEKKIALSAARDGL